MSPTLSRRARALDFVLLICFTFVVLTSLAMLFYPGGTQKNPNSAGYSFALNFFSDLGRTRTLGGHLNPLSSALFTLALSSAGVALALFFAVFAGFFWTNLAARSISLLGAVLGVAAGAAFIGVAFVTADHNSRLHGLFVLTAFRAFFGATLIFALAMLIQSSYPRLGAAIFLLFATCLVAYIALISVGPSPKQPGGLAIQVVGQKLIVYASIFCVGAQTLLARRFLRTKAIPKSAFPAPVPRRQSSGSGV